MYQNEVITKPEIEEIEDRNESGGVAGYTGIVRFEIVATGGKRHSAVVALQSQQHMKMQHKQL